MLIVFVFSTGRSGTQAVAKAFHLAHEDGNLRARVNPSVEEFKKKAEVAIEKDYKVFGSASNFWKSKIPEIKKTLPQAILIHLVRNGEGVVKSFWNRQHYRYTKCDLDNPNYDYRNELLPIDGFEGLSRFDKICTSWDYWNRTIEEQVPLRIRLEDLNIPNYHKGPSHKEWTGEERVAFNRICGETMTRYGYKING